MKLRLPHNFLAALTAALASLSFSTLGSGSLAAAGTALFGFSAAAEEIDTDDAAAQATIDTHNIEVEIDPMKQEEEKMELAITKAKEVGSNGFSGNNADLLQTDTFTGEADALDSAYTAEQVEAATATTGGDSQPADNLGFTDDTYATGTGTSNGSDSVFEVTPAAAAAVLTTDFQQQATTESTASGTTPSTTGTAKESDASSSGATGFGGRSTPTLRLSTFSLGSTSPAISMPLATGLSVDTGSSSSGTIAAVGAAILTGQKAVATAKDTVISNANQSAAVLVEGNITLSNITSSMTNTGTGNPPTKTNYRDSFTYTPVNIGNGTGQGKRIRGVSCGIVS